MADQYADLPSGFEVASSPAPPVSAGSDIPAGFEVETLPAGWKLSKPVDTVGNLLREEAARSRGTLPLPGALGQPNEPAIDTANPLSPIQSLTQRDFDSNPNVQGVREISAGVQQFRRGLQQKGVTGTMGMYGVPLPAPPMNPDVAGGAAHVLGGTMQQGAITLPAVIAANPESILPIGAAILAQQGTKDALDQAGTNPEYSRLISQAVGLATPLAYGGAKLSLNYFERAIDAHNAVADHLFHLDATRGRQIADGAALAVKLFDDPIPVRVLGRDAEIRLAGVGEGQQTAGRPAFQVVDTASNQRLFAGFGRNVEEWLRSNGAEGAGRAGSSPDEPPPVVEQQQQQQAPASVPPQPAPARASEAATEPAAPGSLGTGTGSANSLTTEQPSDVPLGFQVEETPKAEPEPAKAGDKSDKSQQIAELADRLADHATGQNTDLEERKRLTNEAAALFNSGLTPEDKHQFAQQVEPQLNAVGKPKGQGVNGLFTKPEAKAPAAEGQGVDALFPSKPAEPAPEIQAESSGAPTWAQQDQESAARAKAKRIIVAEDKDSGTAGIIAQHDDGKWFGGLLDTEADKVVEHGRIYPTREAAEAYAKSLIPAASQHSDIPEGFVEARPSEEPAPEKPVTPQVEDGTRNAKAPPAEAKVTYLNDDFGNWSVPTGSKLVSESGRALAPAPKFDASTNKKRNLSLTRQRAWLVSEAQKEAAAKSDEYMKRTFDSMQPNNFTRSDADTVNDYLFGDTDGPSEKHFASPAPAGVSTEAKAPATIEADESRLSNPEALEGAPSEVRGESGAEGPTGSDRGTSGDAALGDVQRTEGEGTGARSGDRDSAGAVDHSGEREPAERPVGAGDLDRQTANRDFRITDETGVGEGTQRQKLNANLDAIRTVKQLAADQREATADEQRKLALYVGWGGMPQIFDYGKREWSGAREELQSLLTPEEYKAAEASTKNAHYTSPQVVRAMWDALQRLGVKPTFTVLEPSMGIGNFFGLQPDSLLPARRTGIELDAITAQIAKALYPDSNVIHSGFEKISLPNDFFDVAISNVPFGNYPVHDPKYRKTPLATRAIHNYFFLKSLDLVRPGGIVAFITSRYTMDAQDPSLRKLIASKGDLVGMVRLPDTAFKGNAGTEVVTDAIFLRKRAEGEAPSGPSFENTQEVDVEDGGQTVINEYYAAHPEMMLGKLSLQGSMYGPGQQSLKGDLTPEILRDAIDKLPQAIYREWKAETPAFDGAGYIQLGDAVKDGGYDVRDGVVVQREGNIFRPVAKLGKTQEARIRGMIPVRNAVRMVFQTQLIEAPEKEIVTARKKLNTVYDDFVKKFGPVQSAANSRAMGDDPDYPVMAALEDNFDKEKNTAEKAAIFTKRTIEKPKTPDKADTAAEALAISLNERGRLDWDFMQQLTGKTPEEMRAEMGGIVFQNPDGRKWETADGYLSGNVRQKLELAQEAAKADPKFERNVEALEKVQPRDLEPHEIRVTLGAPWIPSTVIADFLKKVLDLDGAKAHYAPSVASWSIDVPKWAQQRTANTVTYGTPDYNAHELVDLALSGKSPKVYTGPSDARVVNPQATAVAQAAMMALKEKFKEWVWEQPYAGQLAAIYNRELNSLRLVEYDGSHLTLPGSNPAIQLRPHQKDVIWRALKTGNTLLAHEVGAGKTWEMVGIAMESRRLGLAKKPMLVIPNHMAEQVATEFAQLYPAARILTVGQEDFAGDKRKKAIARIASGTWDAVIVRHASFERIPVSDQTYQAFVDSQIDDLRAALEEQKKDVGKGAEKDKTVKEIQKAISRLEVKLQKRLAREKKDNAASFEELGVDLLLVDEAHAFKKLPIITRRTRVAGIPTKESNRATDMLMKTQYVSQLSGGRRGVIFATGTPVTNTMAELYNMQRYLQLKAMQEAGVAHFDAWANTFGEVVRGTELDVSGKGFRENERFAKFINIPELLTMYRQVADVKTAEMMKLPRPDLEGGGPQPVTAPESPELTKFVDHLVKRSEVIRKGQIDKSKDNMLKVVGEGKKAALDMRLVDPHAEDRPDSKVNKAAQNIFDIWQESKADRATQIVFCDLSTPKSKKKAAAAAAKAKANPDEEESEDGSEQLVAQGAGELAGFSVYNDMRDKLIHMGIPSHEIAFVHDYNGDDAKQELFDAVNAGKIRVLMGSTAKMGVGTNVQRRALALHHMDAPWFPADIKQRDGRIQRQGNIHKTVKIFQYLTEGSFDAYMWQLLETKAKFIAPILSGELNVREMEDIGMVLPSAAEFKAIASGNPLIKDKITTDGALARLDAQRAGFRKQQAGITSQLAALPGMIESAQRVAKEIGSDIRTIQANKDVGYTFGKQSFQGEDARKQAADAIGKVLSSWKGPGNPQKIGTYRGLELWTKPYFSADAYPGITIRGAHSYTANTNPENPAATLSSIESTVRNLPDKLVPWEKGLEEHVKKQKDLQGQLGRTWPHEKQYQELIQKKAGIDAQLAESSAEQASTGDDETPAAPQKSAGDGDVYMGSGLGALQPYVEKFFREDILPTAQQAGELLKATRQDILKMLAPAARPGSETAALSVRANAAELARATDRAEAALKIAKKFFDAQPESDNFEFIDRVENGQAQPNPDLQNIANVMRDILDTRRGAIQNLGTGKLQNFIEDYFPHLWDVSRGPAASILNQSKRPFEGAKAFLKKRTIETFAAGIAAGLTPISTNPVELVLAKAREMDKYLTAHSILKDLKDAGQLVFLRASKAVPDGWSKINDNVATVWGTPSHQGARQIEGYYIAPEPAARILNNYLSPGLREKSGAFRAYLGLANLINQAQLGFSAFHLGFTTMDVAVSKFALAIYQGGHGDVLKGLKSAALTPISPFTNLMRGDKMLKEWYNPGTQGALIGELIDAMTRAGGRARMDSFYSTQITKKLVEAWHKNNLLGVVARLPFAALEATTKPIMEWLVPRQKMGVFADLAQYELERLGTHATDPDVQAALARAWDSVDNRLGQLVYDNLFWHKIAKDLAMASIRSVGWNVGTMRELAGGLADTAGAARHLATGNGSGGDFTPRMSYVIALPILIGLIGAIAYYLKHGHGPRHLKDYYAPNGYMLPSYMKDVISWGSDPARTAQGKVHPLLALIWEMLANKDYYGHAIANPHHPWVKRQEERVSFALQQFAPIAYRHDAQHHHMTETERALAFFGVKRAPKALTK